MGDNTGRFVWFELLTSDPRAAIRFYTEAIGWKAEAFGDSYTMFVSGQGPLGGVAQLPELAKQAGAPPYWQANIEVEDLAAAVAKVTDLGGRIIHSENVPDVGNFAVIADPQGAVVSLFTPARSMPSHDAAQNAEFSWHELVTTDHNAAFLFYGALLGWEKMGEHDMGDMGSYILWGREGKQLGGMMNIPPGVPMRPGWLYYVTAIDFEATLELAKAKGATVLNGPHDVPGGMRIVQLRDPQGAAFAFVSTPAQ